MPAPNRPEVDGFKQRLEGRMADRGFSMRSLSEAADLGPTTIRDILKRGRSPSLDTLQPIAAALGTTVAWLVGSETDTTAPQSGGILPRASLSRSVLIRADAVREAERIVAQAGPINAAPRDVVRQILVDVLGFQVEEPDGPQ